MDVVTTLKEIEENLSLFEDYLCEGSDVEQQFAYDLVKKGSCFIAYQIGGEFRFA